MSPVRILHGGRGNPCCLDTFPEAGKMEKARRVRPLARNAGELLQGG